MSKELEDLMEFCAHNNYTLKISKDGLRYRAEGDGMIFRREATSWPGDTSQIAQEFLEDLKYFKQYGPRYKQANNE